MRYISILFAFTLYACSSNSDPKPENGSLFTGKYFYSAKDHESGDYGAMDLVVSVSDKNEVNITDDFTDPSNLGVGKASGSSLTATQHVDDKFDTRDIKLTMTNDKGIMHFEYDVDFTQATGDYHIEGILTKQ